MVTAVVPSSIVFEVLEKDNYESWRETIQSYLEFKDLWDVVESNEQPPDIDAEEANFKAWKKKNSKALHAIQISCGRHFLSKIRGIREADIAWRTLEVNFNPPLPRRMVYNINPEQEFASKFLKDHPHLIFAKDVNGLSPLYVAARAPHLFVSHRFALSPFPYKFSKLAYYFVSIFCQRRLPKLYDLREYLQLRVIDRLIAIRNAIRDSNMTSDVLRDAFFEAIKCGNFNFIVMLINYDKKILEEVNDMSKNIYMCAIEYRQAKVFSLIFWDKKQEGDREKYAKVCEDKWKNNLLHMAATWTPPEALDRIPKSALLMIREAMWFKEVSKLSSNLMTTFNIDGKIPYELFKETHRNLMTGAERGMKESAASWAIVGPLVITIMFAAAFQIPGGYNQETGFPIFLNKMWFKLYMVLVSISLFSATISVLKFLEIPSPDYQEKDFLSSLRTYERTYNVITGTLFLSLATMLVAFCLGLFLTLHGERAIFLPIAVTATFLVGYIVYTKFPLLVESFTTYKWKSSLFDEDIGDEVELIFEKLNR